MKKYLGLFALVLILLVSCQQNPPVEVVPTYLIKVENKANETIYLNIRKASEPSSDVYKPLINGKALVVYTEAETAYIVTYSLVTGQKYEIKDGVLETIKTTSELQTIELTMDFLWNDVTITGTTTWNIEQR